MIDDFDNPFKELMGQMRSENVEKPIATRLVTRLREISEPINNQDNYGQGAPGIDLGFDLEGKDFRGAIYENIPEDEASKLREEIDELEQDYVEEIKRLREESTVKDAKIDDLSQAQESLEAELGFSKKELQRARITGDTILNLVEEINELEGGSMAEIKRLRKESKAKTNEIEGLTKSASSLKAELDLVKNEFEKATISEKEFKHLKKDSKAKADEIARLTRSANSLRSELDSARKELSEVKALENNFEKTKAQVENDYVDEIKRLMNVSKTKTVEAAELTQSAESLKVELDLARKELEKAMASESDVEKVRIHIEQKHAEEIRRLRKDSESMAIEIAELTKSNDSLTAELDSTKKELEIALVLVTEVERGKSQLEQELVLDIKRLKKESKEKTAEIAEFTKSAESLRAELESAKKELEKERISDDQIERVKSQIEGDYVDEIKRLRKKTKAKAGKITELTNSADSFKAELVSAKKKLEEGSVSEGDVEKVRAQLEGNSKTLTGIKGKIIEIEGQYESSCQKVEDLVLQLENVVSMSKIFLTPLVALNSELKNEIDRAQDDCLQLL